ncbi:MAG: 23S rRNA (guanosine(2251)-2'-O)-methyltransferase RlmB [Flavobacteriales bacterium]
MKTTPYTGPKRPKEKSLLIGWHPILEALQAGKSIDRILLNREARDDRAGELLGLAQKANVPILRVPKAKLDKLTLKNHQGIVGFISPIAFQPLDELIAQSWETGRTPHVLMVDGVTDVRNIGAIARSAECFGLTALIVPHSGVAPLREDAIKSSSGALLRIPVARVDSVDNGLDYLHTNGFQTVGMTEKAEHTLSTFAAEGPIAWILGDEGQGLSEESMRKCQTLLKIPMVGTTGSLNVSVAAGIALHHHMIQQGLMDTRGT